MPSVSTVVNSEYVLPDAQVRKLFARGRHAQHMVQPVNEANAPGEAGGMPVVGALWTGKGMIQGSGPGMPLMSKQAGFGMRPVRSVQEASAAAYGGTPSRPENRISYGIGKGLRQAFDSSTAPGSWWGDRHPAAGALQGAAIGLPAAAGLTWLYKLLSGSDVGYRMPLAALGTAGAALGASRAVNNQTGKAP